MRKVELVFESLPDLEDTVRRYWPKGAKCPPAGFAKEGASFWTLAKLLDDVPIPEPDSVDAVADKAEPEPWR